MDIYKVVYAILAMIMFAVGMSIKLKAFKVVFTHPKEFILGLFLQMVLLPFLAFFLSYFSPFSPAIKVGIVILSLCPGGTTSNYISYLVKANTALSISLTSVNSFLSMFTIPFLTNEVLKFYLKESMTIALPFLDTVSQILGVILLPALAGALFHKYKPDLVRVLTKPFKIITLVLLFITYSVLIFGENGSGIDFKKNEVYLLFIFTFILNIFAIGIGFLLPFFLKVTYLDRLTLSIEVGLQNSALAILISGGIIGINDMAKPAMVYASFTFFTTLLFSWLMRQRNH